MPNPDVKAVRAALEKARHRVDPAPDPEGNTAARLAAAFITHGLSVCDLHDRLEGVFRGDGRSMHGRELNLIAGILSDANLLPKEGA